MVWNGFDYTTCVFPVTKVDPATDVKKPAHSFLSDKDKNVYELCVLSVHCLGACLTLVHR